LDEEFDEACLYVLYGEHIFNIHDKYGWKSVATRLRYRSRKII